MRALCAEGQRGKKKGKKKKKKLQRRVVRVKDTHGRRKTCSYQVGIFSAALVLRASPPAEASVRLRRRLLRNELLAAGLYRGAPVLSVLRMGGGGGEQREGWRGRGGGGGGPPAGTKAGRMMMQPAGRCHIQRDSPQISLEADRTGMFLTLRFSYSVVVRLCLARQTRPTFRRILSDKTQY